MKQYPRRIFGGSRVFADMLTLPQDGESEAHPLRLDDLELKDMIQFAWAAEAWCAAAPTTRGRH